MASSSSFLVLLLCLLCCGALAAALWTGPTGRATRFIEAYHHGSKLQVSLNEPKLCAPDVQQYSGYIQLSANKSYFFWFFESRAAAPAPFVAFFNGGPGCSSLIAALQEVGACSINDDLTEKPNPYAWINVANMIYIDAPNGAGYSYGSDYVKNTREYAVDVYGFLQLFFAEFPKYASLDFHIFGESYAGHYIPAVATEIVKGNAVPSNIPINLKSIGLGNALVDPLTQYPAYPKMGCNNSYGIQVFNQGVCDLMDDRMESCLTRIEKCYNDDTWAPCVSAGLSCNLVMISPIKLARSNLNPYDIRIPCEVRGLCYDFSAMEEYLQSDYVKQELGTVGHRWKDCNYGLNLAFQLIGADWMRPYQRDLPPLLDEHGIRVLVFSGDADFIVSWYGSKNFTLSLPWSGQRFFQSAEEVLWNFNGVRAGEARSYGPLTFLRNYNAGHMVPMDQPAAALDMFTRWLNAQPFN